MELKNEAGTRGGCDSLSEVTHVIHQGTLLLRMISCYHGVVS